jgi:hypothetical protein
VSHSALGGCGGNGGGNGGGDGGLHVYGGACGCVSARNALGRNARTRAAYTRRTLEAEAAEAAEVKVMAAGCGGGTHTCIGMGMQTLDGRWINETN